MGRNHLRVLRQLPDVFVVGVADPNIHMIDHGLNDTNLYLDPVDLLDQRLDAVVIASPTNTHAVYADVALSHGEAVFVEKPLAGTVAEGADLVDRVEQVGGQLQVGHIERFNPAVVELEKHLRRGALSQIYSIKAVRAGPFPARIRDVGVAVDLAIHDIDVICSLLAEVPIEVQSKARSMLTDHEDMLVANLIYASGIIATLEVNWLSPDKERTLTVLGPEGQFRVDYLRQILTFTRGADTLQPRYLGGYAPLLAGETRPLAVKPAEPLRRELEAFVSMVRTRGASPVSAADGLRALIVAEQMSLVKVPA
jgi:UDP-N-acetylglucosamine 3-dehydrogenase